MLFKKILSIVSVAAIASAALVGCSCSGDNSNNVSSKEFEPNAVSNSVVDGAYTNQNYKYSLTIPGEVKDDVSINGNDSVVTIYDKYCMDKDAKDETGREYQGKLATIWADNKGTTPPYENYKVLGEDDKHLYVLQYPEEDQYDPNDEKAKASYENTVAYLDEIAASFKLG